MLSAQLIGTVALPNDAAYPEAIAFDERSGFLFVSCASDGSVFAGQHDDLRFRRLLKGGEDGRRTALGLDLWEGLLIVAGGATGVVLAYGASSGRLHGRFSTAGLYPSATTSPRHAMLNDIAIVEGAAFITDSFIPILFRADLTRLRSGGQVEHFLEPWIELSGSPIEYQNEEGGGGINLNGIVPVPGTPLLLTVQTNVGRLYTINMVTSRIASVAVSGESLVGADGLVIDRGRLIVIGSYGAPVVRVESRDGWRTAGASKIPLSAELDTPTGAVLLGDELIVVNSQLGTFLNGQRPSVPFTLSRFQLP